MALMSSACRLLRRSALVLVASATLAAALSISGHAAPDVVPPSLYSGFEWRLIGPYRGGRVLSVTGVPSEPDTYYLGAAIGGVWKTTDGGHLWRPLFDAEDVQSIGAIAVAPSNPDVVYVGTGESDPREDVSFGDGMYKSIDAGKTWTHIGLADTQHIARIVIDPSNPDIVLVAAVGHIFGPNAERGVFRTTDGGATWQKVLYKDEQTGAIDLESDPAHPTVLYAALWQMSRKPWLLSSGGPLSGLYKSTDEGVTWTPIAGHGLPEGVLGKIGISVAPGTNGRRVYALIEAKAGGLYRSDDGGETWELVNSQHLLWSRAWYFTRVVAHPTAPDAVYITGNAFWKSIDGGKTFKQITIPGGDNHDVWINPHSPSHLIEGHDQGIVISVDGGATWDKRNNLPIGQFYHASTDQAFPFGIYGAQQDMGAIRIANAGWGGITDKDWHDIGGDDGECGYVWPLPGDPRYVVAGGYNGALTIFDSLSHQLRDIAPWSNASGGHPASEMKYRFTWTSPVVFSPTDPHALYMGSQYLMQTTDLGQSWKIVSPDLTRNDGSKQVLSGGPITKDNASVEYYDVIFSIAPSPVERGLIWIGTDDGLVQKTTNGGATWLKVTPPGVPEWAKISLIEASRFDASTAYVAVDAHKLDDMTPYIFRTRDGGRTWTRITNGLAAPGFVYSVREDPKRRGLLFAGTETGIDVSFDDGDSWQPLQFNLPHTSVRDITVNGDTLVIATHGRSFWAIDDISPLRQAAADIAGESLHLFTPATAVRMHEADTYTMPTTPAGENPPDGAVFNYYVGPSTAGKLTIDVRDAQGRRAFFASSAKGEESATTALAATPGMHRVVWDLRYPLPALIRTAAYDERSPRGVVAVAGQYRVTLSMGDRHVTAPLTVTNDPRSPTAPAAMEAEFALADQLMAMLGTLHASVGEILHARDQIEALRAKASPAPTESLNAFDARMEPVLHALYEPDARVNVDLLNYPMELNARIAYLEDEVDFGDGAPTTQFVEMTREYGQELDAQIAEWNRLKQTALPILNQHLATAGLPPVTIK
jgi:photosystem II stability/assembly factor-like uncharacterized protein